MVSHFDEIRIAVCDSHEIGVPNTFAAATAVANEFAVGVHLSLSVEVGFGVHHAQQDRVAFHIHHTVCVSVAVVRSTVPLGQRVTVGERVGQVHKSFCLNFAVVLTDALCLAIYVSISVHQQHSVKVID